ncbi:MAG TPA: PKD domain-containing protein [Silvibacterium sp.]|nr:PKD domain-containing protein [Silvibacterium sp.]
MESILTGESFRAIVNCGLGILLLACWPCASLRAQTENSELNVKIDPADGSYTLSDSAGASLNAGVAAKIDGRWLQSKDYPHHSETHAQIADDLGPAEEWTVAFSGLNGEPDLVYRLRHYADKPFADIQATVDNTTSKSIEVEAIRPLAAAGSPMLNLGGSAADDRILSDSFSEDRPAITIHDFGTYDDGSPDLYRAVGSQLIYNRKSHESFFAGALTSDRFLTILRIHVTNNSGGKQIAAYEVDSTGTTELEEDNSLRDTPAADRVALRLPLAAGAQMVSERLLLSLDTDYHRQLETYGHIIRQLHHPRVSEPTPLGWWSWTAYYFGLSSGTALTNAGWEAQHLKQLGYDFFHIDEGYQYARGEYTTPDATLFPNGIAPLERKVTGMGLIPGIWTAPFEVSERSWVYQKHPDWLVHNAQGQPIPAGWVTRKQDQLYMLDCTNPGAQQYLRQTYSTLVHVWGIRYIKLDFMDDSAIEGYYYRPHTTAMEAQRIGLDVIRQTVGDDVLLDKDGSAMLNPVGYVDFGRISQDAGHAFSSSREAAPGIAARYYMNRNFFVADPDAFTVSEQMVGERPRHKGMHPLTLDEAKVSIALAAVSGGMFEIGDDLPILGSEPERLALVENQDLIEMARLGRSSTPLDLMSYLPEDRQPSIFLLKESRRQSVLTIFNWTETPRTHDVTLATLDLNGKGPYSVTDVFDQKELTNSNSIVVTQPPHSVRVLKIIDTAVPAEAPPVRAEHPSSAAAGETVKFTANTSDSETPAITYHWDFGDGVSAQGQQVPHAYTHPGDYLVTLSGTGLDGMIGKTQFRIAVNGFISTRFEPANIHRGTSDQ